MMSVEFRIKAAFIAAIVLAGMTLVFCCLTVIAGTGQRCVGREWSVDDHPASSFGLLVGSVFVVFMIGNAALRLRSMRWTYIKAEGILSKIVPVPPPMRFADAAYGPVVGVLVMQVVISGFAIARWHTVLTECTSQP